MAGPSVGQTFWVLAAAGPSFGIDSSGCAWLPTGLGFALEAGTSKSPDIDHPGPSAGKQLAFDLQWRFDTGPSIRPWVFPRHGLRGRFDSSIDGAAELPELGAHGGTSPGWASASTSSWVGPRAGPLFILGVAGAHPLAERGTIRAGADTGRSLKSAEVGVRALLGF